MRVRSWVLAVAVLAVFAAGASAEPDTSPRAEVDQTFTTTAPGTPTGIGYSGTFHAADDPSGDPPFMERMVFFPPAGMRYDTTVPPACTASDFELSMQGPAACAAGSQLGTGTTEGVFFIPFTDRNAVLDRYTHNVYIHNNLNEQIILVEAEGYAVIRGAFQPDGSLVFDSPTCFPTPPTGECLDDHVLQTATTTAIAPYTNERGSYATTPPTCPKERRWTSRIKLWWADGNIDEVTPTQPCTRGGGGRPPR